jgi:hypothetical protein
MKSNWIKMYDKGIVLRVETVINDPEEFRVRRRVRRNGRDAMAWVPLRKSVTMLFRANTPCTASPTVMCDSTSRGPRIRWHRKLKSSLVKSRASSGAFTHTGSSPRSRALVVGASPFLAAEP